MGGDEDSIAVSAKLGSRRKREIAAESLGPAEALNDARPSS
jgi:hypothetical protein